MPRRADPWSPKGLVCPPAHLWVPPHATSTKGPLYLELAEMSGLALDPEQKLALNVLLAESRPGKWAALDGCIVAPRQNVKTFILMVIVLGDVYLRDDVELVTWTAHKLTTSKATYEELRKIILRPGNRHLAKRVKNFNDTNGEEAIEFWSGAQIQFRARAGGQGRGLTGDRVVLDEALYLVPSHLGDLIPTLSARSVEGNPGILYGSSPGKPVSAMLRELRRRGRSKTDPSLTYIEWNGEPLPGEACAEEGCDHRKDVEGCLLDSEPLIRRGNLAIDRRITIEFTRTERRSMPVEEYARERAGWWEDPPGGDEDGWHVVEKPAWEACLDAEVVTEEEGGGGWEPVGRLGWSVDVSPDSWSAAICVSDGVHGEVVDYRPGTAWVVARCQELGIGRVAIDADGPAGTLEKPLKKKGIAVRRVTAREHTVALGGWLRDIRDRVFRHIDQTELTDAVKYAVKRPVRDVFLLARAKSEADICPAVGVTLARDEALRLQAGGGVVGDIDDEDVAAALAAIEEDEADAD